MGQVIYIEDFAFSKVQRDLQLKIEEFIDALDLFYDQEMEDRFKPYHEQKQARELRESEKKLMIEDLVVMADQLTDKEEFVSEREDVIWLLVRLGA